MLVSLNKKICFIIHAFLKAMKFVTMATTCHCMPLIPHRCMCVPHYYYCGRKIKSKSLGWPLWHDHLYQISSKSTHWFLTSNVWMKIRQTWSLLYAFCSCNCCRDCILTVRFYSRLFWATTSWYCRMYTPSSYCWNKNTIFKLEAILWKAINSLELLH